MKREKIVHFQIGAVPIQMNDFWLLLDKLLEKLPQKVTNVNRITVPSHMALNRQKTAQREGPLTRSDCSAFLATPPSNTLVDHRATERHPLLLMS